RPSALPEADDPSRIHPPFLAPPPLEAQDAGMRSGHDISLEVRIDAGRRARDLASPTHQVIVRSDGRGGDIVRVAPGDSIPNRDFVLRYTTEETVPGLSVFAHRAGDEGYVMALVQPSLDPNPDDLAPKELVFLV